MNQRDESIRVVVVDDEPLVRAGIVSVLETDSAITVVAQAADGIVALDLVDSHRPDVVLLDIQMPGLSGLDVLKRLRAGEDRVPCVIVTTFGEDDYVMEAITSDADGFVLKSGDPRHLLAAVHAAAGQGAFFSPSIARRILDSAVVEQYFAHTNALRRFELLTPREREILVRLSEGATNAEIASALHLAQGTVKVHVSSILRTTGARNRVEAALIAIHARQV